MTIRLFAINPSFDFYLLFCGSREPRESIKLHTFPSQILDHATIYVCVYMISYYTRTHIYTYIGSSSTCYFSLLEVGFIQVPIFNCMFVMGKINVKRM